MFLNSKKVNDSFIYLLQLNFNNKHDRFLTESNINKIVELILKSLDVGIIIKLIELNFDKKYIKNNIINSTFLKKIKELLTSSSN